MNCKFCGNFVPDGTDSCPVCGRRPTEEPMGKLLSENQPSNFTAASPAAIAAPDDSKKNNGAKEPKKGLVAPLVAIAASVVGWLVAWTQGIWDTIKTIFNGTYGQSSNLGENSGFTAGGATSAFGDASQTVILIIAIAAIITLIGIIGLITLFKRLFSRAK